MRVYIDSSVVLRIVLKEPSALKIWPKIDEPVSSELIQVECLRTIDRARINRLQSDDELAQRRSEVFDLIGAVDLLPIHRTVLRRASEPFPTSLGSLDAIHLASALLVREVVDELSLATHDEQLARAALAMGFRVHG